MSPGPSGAPQHEPPGPGLAPPPEIVGLVLAAGAGRRMGTPKALLHDADGTPRTLVAARGLLEAGCREVVVVLGAAAAEAEVLLRAERRPEEVVTPVVAADWAAGMGLSLRAGLQAVAPARESVAAALVMLVDLPDVGAAVHRRVVTRWRAGGSSSDSLLRATYAGTPGHPVLLGREHWVPLAAELGGDAGAQRYLVRHRVRSVTCEDLASGRDVDRPEDLAVPDPGPGPRDGR